MIMSNDVQLQSSFESYSARHPNWQIRFVDSLRDAATKLEASANTEPHILNILIVSVDEWAHEPGNVQQKLAQLQNSTGLWILGGLPTGQKMPAFIHPIIVGDTVQYPFVYEEITRRIDFYVKYKNAEAGKRWAETVLDTLGQPLIVLNAAGIISFANIPAANTLGRQEKDLIDCDIYAVTDEKNRDPAIRGSLRQVLNGLRPGKSARPADLRFRKNGSEIIFADGVVKKSAGLDTDVGAVLVFRDVTVQRQKMAELQLSSKVFESSGEAIMITDSEDRILSVNGAFTHLTGYTLEEVVGRKPDFLSAGRESDDFFEKMWDVVHQKGHWKGEVWNRRKDGGLYAEWLAISAVRGDSGEVDHYISIFSDITERKMREEHIQHQAQHDFLTGLPNRILLEDRFNWIVASARRHHQQIAILFIDLDGFKSINDTLGHRVGDALLCAMAQRLREAVRSSDTVSRHGGDEFVCLLTELESTGAAIKIADEMLKSLQQPIPVDHHLPEVTASIGISIHPMHGQTLEELMARADEAMYAAKRQGRNQYVLYGG
jgi:diguanylate cyclase (GGDEF)-like protein/PAS domain S-box-containing protein